jgi:hypothetical protein
MRIIRFLIFYVMVSVLGLMVLVFLALNHYTIQIDMVKAQYPVSVAWVMIGAALFGFVIALLLLLPGRLAAGMHIRALARDVRDLERLLADREDLLEEQEDYIEGREELRARLIEQHEELLERHELILARHQDLVGDHDRVTAQRDEARAQLTALRIARPAAHGSAASGAATALRLLPQTSPATVVRPTTPVPAPVPVPAARPANPVPVGRVATPASEAGAHAEPVKQPAQPAPAPEPLRLVEPAATVETAADTTVEAREAVEAESAPNTVPVTSPVPAVAAASTTPAKEPPVTQETPRRPRMPRTQWNIVVDARAGAARVQQSAEMTLARLRRNTGKLWSEATAQVSTQSRAQVARLRDLQQHVIAGLTANRNEQAAADDITDESAGE